MPEQYYPPFSRQDQAILGRNPEMSGWLALGSRPANVGRLAGQWNDEKAHNLRS
jgi:hypothetical protein